MSRKRKTAMASNQILSKNNTSESISDRNLENVTNRVMSTSENAISTTTEIYDHEGAMQFVVCTIVVYAVMGVFCSLVVTVKRKSSPDYVIKDQDEAVEKYLKTRRFLQSETDKMHMRKEIQRYAESIARFEEKLRLLEEERRREAERLAAMVETERTQRLNIKKDKSRKLSFSFFPTRKQHSLQKHRKMSLAESSLGKIGLSFLFVQATEGNSQSASRSTLHDIEEEIEQEDKGHTLQNKPKYITDSFAPENIKCSDTDCGSTYSCKNILMPPEQHRSISGPVDLETPHAPDEMECLPLIHVTGAEGYTRPNTCTKYSNILPANMELIDEDSV